MDHLTYRESSGISKVSYVKKLVDYTQSVTNVRVPYLGCLFCLFWEKRTSYIRSPPLYSFTFHITVRYFTILLVILSHFLISYQEQPLIHHMLVPVVKTPPVKTMAHTTSGLRLKFETQINSFD